MDRLSVDARSRLMGRIGSKNTAPELAVRRVAHRLGFRFRLHRRDLPGKPDLVFPRLKLAMFVHGCFWHRHEACRRSTIPQTRTDFWRAKFDRNQERDRQVEGALAQQGWRTTVIWECECRCEDALTVLLKRVLLGAPPDGATGGQITLRK